MSHAVPCAVCKWAISAGARNGRVAQRQSIGCGARRIEPGAGLVWVWVSKQPHPSLDAVDARPRAAGQTMRP